MKLKLKVTLFIAVILVFNVTCAVAFASNSDVEPTFSDIRGHWGETAILEMNFRGIMNGYQDNTFRPNYPVTQLEALVMLVRMSGFEPGDAGQEDHYLINEIFKVPSWATPYVDYALENEITYYKELEKMNLKQPLVRQDAAVLVIRTLGLSKQAAKDASALTFTDAEKINPDVLGYVKLAVEKNIITGTSNNSFLPTNPMSRAEIAAMLTRAQSYLENKSEITQYVGTVKNTDPANLTVAINLTSQEEQAISIPQNTVIYKDNTPITAEGISVGDSIKFLMKTVDDETTGLMILHQPRTSTSLNIEKVNLLSAPVKIQTMVEELKLEEGHFAFIDNRNLYLLVCRGEKTNSGYNVEIKEVTLAEDENILTARYNASDPIPGNLYLTVMDYPYSLIKVNIDNKPSKVIFHSPKGETEVKPRSL